MGNELGAFPTSSLFHDRRKSIVGCCQQVLRSPNLRERCHAEITRLLQLRVRIRKTMAASITFRQAEIDQQKCEEEVKKNQDKTKQGGLMVEWIPNNFKIGVVQMTRLDSDLSATAVVNTTSLKAIFQRLATQFGALL